MALPLRCSSTVVVPEKLFYNADFTTNRTLLNLPRWVVVGSHLNIHVIDQHLFDDSFETWLFFGEQNWTWSGEWTHFICFKHFVSQLIELSVVLFIVVFWSFIYCLLLFFFGGGRGAVFLAENG